MDFNFKKSLARNFFGKVNYQEGNITPFYDFAEEEKFISNPLKVAFGENFIQECQSGKKSCEGMTKSTYDDFSRYLKVKFFENVGVYPSGKSCKEIAGNNDLSYYWCKNKKDFYNYNFEIFFSIINIIILCLAILLFHPVR